MAHLSKEAYDRKREWAARKHERQKAITSLTEEQHDALAKHGTEYAPSGATRIY